MANQEDLQPGTQWIEVADFRPGIYATAYSDTQRDVTVGDRPAYTAPNAPLGAAVANGTEGCVSSPTGALVAGPLWVSKFDNPYYSDPPLYTMGSAILSPVSSTLSSDLDVQPDWLCVGQLAQSTAIHAPDIDFAVLFETFYTGTGVGDPKGFVSHVHRHPVNGQSVTEPLGGVSVCTGLSDKGTIVTVTPPAGNFAAYPFFFCGTSNWIDYINVSGGAPFSDDLDACFVLPNPDTSGANDQYAVLFGTHSGSAYGGGNYHGILNTMHQGRLVWASSAAYLLSLAVNNDPTVIWSRAFDIVKYSANANAAAIDAEFPGTAAYLSDGNGISLMASMDANTLLVIKNHNGGYLIRGDLDRPQVTRLAGVTSTMGKTSLGVMTPLGFVYGAKDGMFGWGGDTSSASTYLSAQLPGTFWTSDHRWPSLVDFAPETPLGKFAYRQPYILAPSDFMFDTRVKSWWKLTRPAEADVSSYTYGRATWGYEVSANGNVYALTTHQQNATEALWNYYDFSRPTLHYKWTSQPIPIVKDRNALIREVSLKVEGIGDVGIRILGYRGEELYQHTFTSTSDAPTTFRDNCSVPTSNSEEASANDLTVEITASFAGTLVSPYVGAPTVHGFRLGVEQAQQIRAS